MAVKKKGFLPVSYLDHPRYRFCDSEIGNPSIFVFLALPGGFFSMESFGSWLRIYTHELSCSHP